MKTAHYQSFCTWRGDRVDDFLFEADKFLLVGGIDESVRSIRLCIRAPQQYLLLLGRRGPGPNHDYREQPK
ncbi:MAG: hypothetical protein ACLQAT_17925 [Candidatus Binataceae bacterium]